MKHWPKKPEDVSEAGWEFAKQHLNHRRSCWTWYDDGEEHVPAPHTLASSFDRAVAELLKVIDERYEVRRGQNAIERLEAEYIAGRYRSGA